MFSLAIERVLIWFLNYFLSLYTRIVQPNDALRRWQLKWSVFAKREEIQAALTHPSATAARPPCSRGQCGITNDRLKFLGDAVISLVESFDLYHQTNLGSAYMTVARSEAVCKRKMALIFDRLSLGELARYQAGLPMSDHVKGGFFRVCCGRCFSLLSYGRESLLA